VIKRRQDWPVRLSAYLTEVGCRKFRWGSHDCVLHCTNAVKAMTGVDLAEDYRNTYRGKASAYRIVRDHFNGSIDNGLTKHFGPMQTNIRKAKRGDILKGYTDDGLEVYGIVDDTGRQAAVVTVDGLGRWPLDNFVGFWSVG